MPTGKKTTRSESDEYATPPEVFLPLHAEYRFTLDPCCRNETAKLERHFTREEDGLLLPWKGERVFMNPPYSVVKLWVRKAFYESRDNGALVVCLVFAWTSSKWWQDYVMPDTRPGIPHSERRLFNASKIIFPRGRINFLLDGVRIGCAMKPSAVVVFDPNHFGPPVLSSMAFGCPSTQARPIEDTGTKPVQGVLRWECGL